MRIKDLFTVPTGQNVTEKHLRRVLISSICSILLCMSCLTGTTWAWFVADVENTGNIIHVAEWKLDVAITKNDSSDTVPCKDGVYTLNEGTYNIAVNFSSDAKGNDLTDRTTVYLIMVENVGQAETKYVATFILNDEGSYDPIQKSYQLGAGEEVKLSFYFTRMNPQIDNNLTAAVFEVEEEETTDATEETETETTASENPTESIDPTESLSGGEMDPVGGTDEGNGDTTEQATVPSGEQSTVPSTEQQTTEEI